MKFRWGTFSASLYTCPMHKKRA